MDFVFKLSFFLHRVTNQNFKKKAKFLTINKPKIESKKNHRKKSLDDDIFPCYIQCIFLLHWVHSPATFSAFSCYIQFIQQWNNIPKRDNGVNHAALFFLPPSFWIAVLCCAEIFHRAQINKRVVHSCELWVEETVSWSVVATLFNAVRDCELILAAVGCVYS